VVVPRSESVDEVGIRIHLDCRCDLDQRVRQLEVTQHSHSAALVSGECGAAHVSGVELLLPELEVQFLVRDPDVYIQFGLQTSLRGKLDVA